MYVDVHLHLYEAPDPKTLVSEAREGGVILLVTNGEDIETSRRCVELAELPGVYAAVGIHPSSSNKPYDRSILENFLNNDRVVAVGEIGLDAKYDIDMDLQRRVFEDMISLASEYDLPIIVHSGRSYQEVAQILFRHDVLADLHWYSGSLDVALELAHSGHFFSLGPASLRGGKYRALIDELPLSQLLTETDYPVRIGGKDNHPLRVQEVVEHIAQVKNISLEETRSAIYNNTLKFFGVRP